MSDDVILYATYALITPAWAALMLAPRSPAARWLCRTAAVSLVLAGVYLVLVLLNLGNRVDGAGFWSMAQLVALFSSPSVVLIGWVHYLAFDLFVGTWIASDAARAGISRWAVLPCLALALMLGPIGLLLYFALRAGWTRSWSVFDPAPASAGPTPDALTGSRTGRP